MIFVFSRLASIKVKNKNTVISCASNFVVMIMFFLELSILVLLVAISNEQVHYVTNSELLIQNDTCYINGEEFYPCATLELLSIKFISTPPEISFKMSIYFLHENYIVKELIHSSANDWIKTLEESKSDLYKLYQ